VTRQEIEMEHFHSQRAASASGQRSRSPSGFGRWNAGTRRSREL